MVQLDIPKKEPATGNRFQANADMREVFSLGRMEIIANR